MLLYKPDRDFQAGSGCPVDPYQQPIVLSVSWPECSARHNGRVSNNHDFINPLGVDVVYTPVRDLPATFFYDCPVAVLEWNSGHVAFTPPVAKPGSLVSHRSRPSALMRS